MIKFVYFDVGGVVIRDFSGTNKWSLLKEELGIFSDKNEEFDSFWDKSEPEVCLGKDVDTLIPLIREKFNSKLPRGYSLLTDGFVSRFEANTTILPVIHNIKRSCKIGLLTNMYPRMLGEIYKRGIMPKVTWDVVIDSSIESVAKPNPKIFRIAQERAGVKGEDILFVENSPRHVKAAQDFGWQTFLYDASNPEDSSIKLLQYFPKD